MTRNMGALDRGLRAFIVAPAAIVVAVIVGASTLAGIILVVLAGVMLATAATGYCPNYTLVGISTDPRPHRVGHHRLRGGHA
jgi:Inner membrane protein YgaP-like, transmembrane domain